MQHVYMCSHCVGCGGNLYFCDLKILLTSFSCSSTLQLVTPTPLLPPLSPVNHPSPPPSPPPPPWDFAIGQRQTGACTWILVCFATWRQTLVLPIADHRGRNHRSLCTKLAGPAVLPAVWAAGQWHHCCRGGLHVQ